MKPSLLLISSWQTINIGDIGHTPGTLRFFEEQLPDVGVDVLLAQTNPAITTMLQRRFPSVRFHEGRIAADGTATHPELQAAFDRAALVVENSGMIHNRHWQNPAPLLRACTARGKAFGLYGQSFDGLHPADEAAKREMFSRATFITCRDSLSLDYLRGLGVQPGFLAWGPDGCFGIDVRNDAVASAWLRERGLEEGKFLAVILRTNTPKSKTVDDPLNPHHPTPDQVAEDAESGRRLRALIAGWIERTGLPVLLAPEVDKEIGPAKSLLLDPLPEALRAKVVHRDTFWNVDEAASVYAHAAALVAMEPHSPIIALANGVPAIHYYLRRHGNKARMFADIGLADWLMEISEVAPEVVLRQLEIIHRDPGSARGRVATAMRVVHEAAHRPARHVIQPLLTRNHP